MLSEADLELVERMLKFYKGRNISPQLGESARLARAWMESTWELRRASWSELEESFEIGNIWKSLPLRKRSIRDIDYNEEFVKTIQGYPQLNRKTLRELERHIELFALWDANSGLRGKSPQEVKTAISYLEELTKGIIQEDAPEASLFFDGERLYWQQEGNNESWLAYSGKEEFWKNKRFSREDQRAKNEGPLPEGWYTVAQTEYQNIPHSGVYAILGLLGPLLQRVVGKNLTAWPGSFISWGYQRVWIYPELGTDPLGRDNFSIHGGYFAGSAGCIDLVENMSEFMERFLLYGRDMELHVSYAKFR